MRAELKALSSHCLNVAVLLAIGVFAATWLLRPLLARSGDTTAELSLKRAGHLEAAGEAELALQAYLEALSRGLRGGADEAHAEKRAGVILLGLNRAEEALAHLQRAQANPSRSLGGYLPLVNALITLDRREDASAMAQLWLDEAAGDAANRADALSALGDLARDAGRLDEATTRYNAALEIEPEHPCRVGLARTLQLKGDVQTARELLLTHLSMAPPGDAANRAWILLDLPPE